MGCRHAQVSRLAFSLMEKHNRKQKSEKPRIFISYSSKDRKVAEGVEENLRSAGFDVWRDQSRLETDWSREIAFALADSNALCLLWSKTAAESKWVKHEWLTARALEKRIYVLRLPGYPKLPEPIHNLQAISLKEGNPGCDELIERLIKETSFTVKHDYTVLPKNSHIPFNPNPNFTGRNTDLLELYLKMIGNLNKIGINQVGAVGMGGIGKTQLAVEFAHRFAFAFNAIYWIQAADTNKWLSEFVSIARDYLQLDIPDPDGPEAKKQYIRALEKHLKGHGNTLIIMDNVAEPDLLNSDTFLFGNAFLTLGCDVLFTTRKHFSLPGVISQQVDTLSPESAYRLLTHGREPKGDEEQKHAHSISNVVGYLPLALTLIAGYLEKYVKVTFADYHEELQKSKLDAIDFGEMSQEELATRHVAAVRVTLKSQCDGLKDEDAKSLFKLAAHFPETAIIPKARLGLLAGIGPGKSKLDRPMERAFNLLHELSLVERLEADASAVRLHPLVREFAACLVPEEERKGFKAEAAQKVKRAYDSFYRLESEFRARGVNQVIDDLQVAIDWLQADGDRLRELELLQSALALSANQLSRDASQLTPQLLGRLMTHDKGAIREMLAEATKSKQGYWLRPLSPSLTQAGGALLRTLEGHNDFVRAVAITPNEELAVSGSADNTLKVWDLSSGEVIRTLKGHAGSVNAVGVTPNGEFALSGSSDNSLKIWDLSSGEVSHTLHGHGAWVNALSISGNGKLALSASSDRTLKVWDLSSGQVTRTLEGHAGWVYAAAITRDGKLAVSGSYDKSLKVWDLVSGKVKRTLKGHSGPVYAAAITSDGKFAISGSADKTLKIWDLNSGELTRTLEGHTDWVYAVALTSDGKSAVSASYDNTVRIWDLSSGEARATLEGHANWVCAVAITPDGNLVVSGSDDKTLKVWDLGSGEVTRTMERHAHGVYAVAINPEGNFALSASSDKTLKIWDFSSLEVIRTLEGHAEGVFAVAITPDGESAVSGSHDCTLKVWHLSSGRLTRTLKGHAGLVNAVAVTPDGKLAVSGSADNTLKVWDLSSGELTRTLEGHAEAVDALAITPDGKLVVSASYDKTLKLWDLGSEKAACTLEGRTGGVNAVAITSDGRLAISASNDWTLRIRDLSSREVTGTLEGHAGFINAVAITPDGNFALSGSYDKTLKVWDLQSGKEVTQFIGESGILACAVAPDGKTIIAGEEGGRVHILRLEGVG